MGHFFTIFKILVVVGIIFLNYRTEKIMVDEIKNNPIGIDWKRSYESSLSSLDQVYKSYIVEKNKEFDQVLSKLSVKNKKDNHHEIRDYIKSLKKYHDQVMKSEVEIANAPVFPTLILSEDDLHFLPFQKGYQSFTTAEFTELSYKIWRLDLHQLVSYVKATKDYSALFRHHVPVNILVDANIKAIEKSLESKADIRVEELKKITAKVLRGIINGLIKKAKTTMTPNLEFNKLDVKTVEFECSNESEKLIHCDPTVLEPYILHVELLSEKKCELNVNYGIALDTKSVWIKQCSGKFNIYYQEGPIVYTVITDTQPLQKAFGTRGFLNETFSKKRKELFEQTENYLSEYSYKDLELLEQAKNDIISTLSKLKYRHSINMQLQLKIDNEKRYKKFQEKMTDIKNVNNNLYDALKMMEALSFRLDRLRSKVYSISHINHISPDYFASIIESVINIDIQRFAELPKIDFGFLETIKSFENYYSCYSQTWQESCNLEVAQQEIESFDKQFVIFLEKGLKSKSYYKSTLLPATESHYSWPSFKKAKENQLPWLEVTL